uniref:RNA polymerase I-specific transcription initiation factor RRN3 n=1 Tax=Bartheletia paradoxa TaxID=669517 RepID=A0A2D0XHP7_9BASI|nr:hypothetical protein SPAR06338 [Bartheletia paradoxa]
MHSLPSTPAKRPVIHRAPVTAMRPSALATTATVSMPATPLTITKGKAVSRKRTRETDESSPSYGSVRRPKSDSTSTSTSTSTGTKGDGGYRKGMYLAFVNDAFTKKRKGDLDAYDDLVGQFKPAQEGSGGTGTSPTTLQAWLDALSHVVSQLDRTHSQLVEVILSVPWTTMSSGFVKAYIGFVGMLVSARPEYLAMVLGKTVKGLTHQSGLRALDDDIGNGSGSANPITRGDIYDRLHTLLQSLLVLIPTLPSTLWPLLSRHFPHKRENRTAQITYIRNVLRIVEYCPELGDEILGTIVDRAIQVDVGTFLLRFQRTRIRKLLTPHVTFVLQVEIQVDIDEDGIDDEDVFEEDDETDPFDKEVGMDDSDSGSDDGSEGDIDDLSSGDEDDEDDASEMVKAQARAKSVANIKEMVAKLDAILKILFDHLERSNTIAKATIDASLMAHGGHSSKSRYKAEEAQSLRRSLFYSLLSIFDRTIIRTFKSRYTQFLVFWYSSLDPEFTDLFQGMLVSKALVELNQPTVTRVAAASYIASFVSRANFVDKDSVRRVVGLLCEYLSSQLEVSARPGQPPPNAQQYGVFYAVAQAVFYIFCFRWRDLLIEPEEEEFDGDVFDGQDGGALPGRGRKWAGGLEIIQRVITSSFNPLKTCSPEVVKQFARIAQRTNFIYCYSIIEQNRRSEYTTLPSSSTPSASAAARALSSLPPNLAAYRSSSSSSPYGARSTPLPAPAAAVRATLAEADLDSFFPFDPYKLRTSMGYIEVIYREWDDVEVDQGSDFEDDDSDEEAEEEEESDDETSSGEGERGTGLSPRDIRGKRQGDEVDREGDEMAASLEAMSFSPARTELGGGRVVAFAV